MSNYVRKGVNFNVDNAHQNELLAWVMAESANNFSGYVKAVLYATMVNKKAGLNSRLNETVNDSGDSTAGN
ncbi:hypothetical protein [Paenibacillus sp. PDC88]|uniref:hypothetical protein n=1 Tax=Paenibacillus sp. PDC88 TaxID=1884375 RepID=UPI0008947D98|nr:hypothetical protein [Paenibacillus sp. PDC88]SDW21696.1 hypothetical protein SAMN05518848_101684 [Paenibacillus sp. PDC88]